MAELKPCPFCGGEAELREEDGRFYVSCENDNCFVVVETRHKVGATKAKATDAWNMRAGNAAEVVRCKDCKHWDKEKAILSPPCWDELLRQDRRK